MKLLISMFLLVTSFSLIAQEKTKCSSVDELIETSDGVSIKGNNIKEYVRYLVPIMTSGAGVPISLADSLTDSMLDQMNSHLQETGEVKGRFSASEGGFTATVSGLFTEMRIDDGRGNSAVYEFIYSAEQDKIIIDNVKSHIGINSSETRKIEFAKLVLANPTLELCGIEDTSPAAKWFVRKIKN